MTLSKSLKEAMSSLRTGMLSELICRLFAPPSGEEVAPHVLTSTFSTYENARTYSDSGRVTSKMRWADQVEVEAFSFSTEFVRGERFDFRAERQFFDDENCARSLHLSFDYKTAHIRWLLAGDVQEIVEPELHVALSSVSSLCGGANWIVPQLLLRDQLRRLYRGLVAQAPSTYTKESVDTGYTVEISSGGGLVLRLSVENASKLIIGARATLTCDEAALRELVVPIGGLVISGTTGSAKAEALDLLSYRESCFPLVVFEQDYDYERSLSGP